MGPIVFFHGLESGPQGRKATFLAERYGAIAPAFDNRAVVRAVEALKEAGWEDAHPSVQAAFAGPLADARAAIDAHRPSLLVGSSFGGALAVALMEERTWVGPTLLLAPAAQRFLGRDVALPKTARVVVIHGRGDDVVPVEDGRALAATGGPEAMFWEVDDGHRLEGALERGILEAAIDWLRRGADR